MDTVFWVAPLQLIFFKVFEQIYEFELRNQSINVNVNSFELFAISTKGQQPGPKTKVPAIDILEWFGFFRCGNCQ